VTPWVGALGASRKFVARPFDLADQRKLVLVGYPDQEPSLFLISNLDFESVWEAAFFGEKDSPSRLEKWACHLDICGKRVDR
jgi:hypothetical protein